MAFRELLVKFGVAMDSASLLKGDTAITQMIGSFRTLGHAMVAGAAAYGIVHFVEGMGEFGHELEATSQKIGVSAEDLLHWRYIAERCGVASESVGQSFKLLQKNAYAASTGSKAMQDSFGTLGVSVLDSAGNLKEGGQLMEEVGGAIGKLDNRAKKIALAKSLLGRGGAEMIPIFNEGADAISQMRKEAVELYGDFGSYIGDSKRMKAEQVQLNAAMMGFKITIAKYLLPVASEVIKFLKDGVQGFKKFVAGTQLVKISLMTLGVFMTAFALKALAAFAAPLAVALLAAVAFGILALIIEDVGKAFAGGTSATESFLASFRGTNQAKQDIINMRDAWQGFLLTMKNDQVIRGMFWNIRYLVKDVGDGFQIIGDAWIDFFYGIADAIATNVLGMVANFKVGIAEIVRVAANVGKYVGIDLSGIVKSTNKSASEAQAAATEARMRTDHTGVQGMGLSSPGIVTATKPQAGASVRAPAPNMSGGPMINQEYSLVVNSPSADPKQVAAEVAKKLKQSQAEQYRQAVDAFSQTTPNMTPAG
jgi:hypothetical protein